MGTISEMFNVISAIYKQINVLKVQVSITINHLPIIYECFNHAQWSNLNKMVVTNDNGLKIRLRI